MPSSRQARISRTAISPRLATSTRLKSRRSERDVAMLLRRIAVAFVLQGLERGDEARARVLGCDDLVDVAELGGLERVGERAPVLRLEALALDVGVLGFLELV